MWVHRGPSVKEISSCLVQYTRVKTRKRAFSVNRCWFRGYVTARGFSSAHSWAFKKLMMPSIMKMFTFVQSTCCPRRAPELAGRGSTTTTSSTFSLRILRTLAVVRLLVSGYSHVGIVPDDAAGRRGFLRDSPFPPRLHSGAAPYSHRLTIIGSQHLDVLIAAQISPLGSAIRLVLDVTCCVLLYIDDPGISRAKARSVITLRVNACRRKIFYGKRQVGKAMFRMMAFGTPSALFLKAHMMATTDRLRSEGMFRDLLKEVAVFQYYIRLLVESENSLLAGTPLAFLPCPALRGIRPTPLRITRPSALRWILVLPQLSRCPGETKEAGGAPPTPAGAKRPVTWITSRQLPRPDGNTARLARRSDEALEVRVSVAHIAPSLLEHVYICLGKNSCVDSGNNTQLYQCCGVFVLHWCRTKEQLFRSPWTAHLLVVLSELVLCVLEQRRWSQNQNLTGIRNQFMIKFSRSRHLSSTTWMIARHKKGVGDHRRPWRVAVEPMNGVVYVTAQSTERRWRYVGWEPDDEPLTSLRLVLVPTHLACRRLQAYNDSISQLLSYPTNRFVVFGQREEYLETVTIAVSVKTRLNAVTIPAHCGVEASEKCEVTVNGLYLEFFCSFEAQKRVRCKDNTDTSNKCLIATRHKTLPFEANTSLNLQPQWGRNRIRLEKASQKQSSDTHKTPYDRVKRCWEHLRRVGADPRPLPGRQCVPLSHCAPAISEGVLTRAWRDSPVLWDSECASISIQHCTINEIFPLQLQFEMCERSPIGTSEHMQGFPGNAPQ
ncbi:hypothetical protein PR048_025149 [Dryococelus australis]|uniref:Uncharacterized protein n=1 Tax=Dryococelus australis TaxID=614101 RepID=A0ABQ9GQM1_9NEOP|nr:hypothetical protein PR048_025149 [Dryococelus australis]